MITDAITERGRHIIEAAPALLAPLLYTSFAWSLTPTATMPALRKEQRPLRAESERLLAADLASLSSTEAQALGDLLRRFNCLCQRFGFTHSGEANDGSWREPLASLLLHHTPAPPLNTSITAVKII